MKKCDQQVVTLSNLSKESTLV